MWRASLLRPLLVFTVLLATSVTNEALCEPEHSPISTFVFVDTYADISKNDPPNVERAYVTQASKNGGPHLNLVAGGIAYDDTVFRAKLSGQYGDSVEANYAAEPLEAWRIVQEGYFGVYLSPKLWVDAGIFFAHIGAESWINTYNPTYTRSLIAEFSPYYESGGRMHYSINDEWSAGLFLLNGWQNISEASHPALGTSLSWTDSKITISSNTFAGSENDGTRLFHDLIMQKKFSSGSIISGSIDLGHQDAAELAGGWWWGYSLTGKTPLTKTLALNGRLESYQDPNTVMMATPDNTPFRVYGLSIGTDIDVGAGVCVRGEAKHLMGVGKVFLDNTATTRTDTLFILSLSLMRDSLL